MAYTKNHIINATVKKAIDYICNPDKTDGKLLIYAYGCSPTTADIEFEWTRQKVKYQQSGEQTHLARHLIQSFAPGETTPEQAHEIGIKWAEEILGGKYEFVLTTHIDKGAIHNHIICNDVSFVDFKHIHINKKWYNQSRRVSDRICEEYGLSVIKEPNKNNSKSYKEYQAEKNGRSWKAQLRKTIDSAIKRSIDFDDFIIRMQIAGYEVKRQNKNISFCNSERNKFVRSKTLGDNYTVEAIIKRIENKKRYRPNNRINLIIDIQNSIKAQQSKGYEHWAKIHNLKQASKTINFLTEHHIMSYEDLENKVNELHTALDDKRDKIKTAERQLNSTAGILKNLNIYNEFQPVYMQYRKSKNKEQFEQEHQRELILYRAAAKALKASGTLPALADLEKDYAELSESKDALYKEYRELKKKCAEIDIIKSNAEAILNIEKEPEPEREPER